MELNDYQELSARTATRHDLELLNFGLGISGEAGEVADLIKKFYFHGHDIEMDKIKKELGDVLWYLSQIARLAGLTLEEVAQGNIDKLKRRYPEGFSVEASIKRVDEDA
ncbi:nucleoside triphosphate pyrophosphohydrolase family protein [Paucisalibacillus globulus]|uniref:nucleoside triphosphate pyrophosphohydrolase family protein n=1 Tax=Paucisalibacillus globulus TaxID=351095 RepID=UPI000BB835EA|nr:nucleoside triphosphate pyrophosphohydrolase family protein [Paucisalibacillus globulus]